MNYTEVFNADIINTRRNIFSIIRSSIEEEYQKRARVNNYNTEFEKIKPIYEKDNSDFGRSLYLYKLEQKNMNIFPIEREAENLKNYVIRLEKFVECMNKKNAEKEIEYKTKYYEFNNLIQTEATKHYKDEINFIRQQITTFKRWLEYVQMVRKYYPEEYKKKETAVELILKQNEVLNALKDKKTEEKDQLLSVFKNERFLIEKDNVLLPDLINKDIMEVVNAMYPKFKEKMILLEERKKLKEKSRVEIQRNDKSTSDNLKIFPGNNNPISNPGVLGEVVSFSDYEVSNIEEDKKGKKVS